MPTTISAKEVALIAPVENPVNAASLAAKALSAVAKTVAPVWPLSDYVAVNPYLGLTGKGFLEAREYLQGFSTCELLMPADYYQQRFKDGHFTRADIDSAIDELVEAGVDGAELLTGTRLEQLLADASNGHVDAAANATLPSSNQMRSISAHYDQLAATSWTIRIHEEIGKHCAAHYDRGQAFWPSPWRDKSLYVAWQSAMRHDRRMGLLGLGRLRELVGGLPNEPATAVAQLLETSCVPQQLWQAYLLCLAYELPGWSAWTQYQAAWLEDGEARVGDGQGDDLVGLIAMRLAYDVALSAQFDYKVDLSGLIDSFVNDPLSSDKNEEETPNDAIVRYALLRANEIAYRNHMLAQMSATCELTCGTDSAEGATGSGTTPIRKLAQVAFCIDVRSERIRRHLESANQQIETIGFAGFFGIPFAYQRLGESSATNQLPVLVPPQFRVAEHLRDATLDRQEAIVARRGFIRTLRKTWKRFQTASSSAFAFVEATGLFFGIKLLRRVLSNRTNTSDPRYDGIAKDDQGRVGPELAAVDVDAPGLTLDKKIDLAASILTGMGLRQDFARLVVFCGHASQTENNPLAAGLDCGACGGHSGEPNARLAAKLLNNSPVREGLLARGIELPAEIYFLAGLHNTTTDEIDFFDVDLVPSTHSQDLDELRKATKAAADQTRRERLPLLSTDNAGDPFRRAVDWSEVRPEWGLTGNAVFVVAPRCLTNSIDLAGRSFLHSYDYRTDPDGKVLEGILTAPMVVGSWINLQYYASTVDPNHFGSGSKTIHNVVGRFGAFSGNGGDLTTGLPWESVHDGARYQHDPVRLLSVVAAPRERIAAILGRHSGVEDLVVNEWIQLVAYDAGRFYRYTPKKTWQATDSPFALNGVATSESVVTHSPVPSLAL